MLKWIDLLQDSGELEYIAEEEFEESDVEDLEVILSVFSLFLSCLQSLPAKILSSNR